MTKLDIAIDILYIVLIGEVISSLFGTSIPYGIVQSAFVLAALFAVTYWVDRK